MTNIRATVKQILSFIKSTAFLLFILSMSGCGSGNPRPVPVSGKVTLDGTPVTAGHVTFSSESGQTATGKIESGGTFQLKTSTDSDGAVPGKYKVGVFVVGKKPMGDEDPVSAAPAKYANPTTSGLSYEVKKGEKNEFTIPLRSK